MNDRRTSFVLFLLFALFSLVASQSAAPPAPAPAASTAPDPSTGGGGGSDLEPMTPGLDLGNGFIIADDGTGFIVKKKQSTFTIRLTCLGEEGKSAEIAYGMKQVIREEEPWDSDMSSNYDEYSQNVGLASPEGAQVNWNIKAIKDKYHMETVPGSKQWIQLLEGNVKANLNIEWPASSYLSRFQICTQVTWDISDEDFPMFMNNNTIIGKKNLTADPPEPKVFYTTEKDTKNKVIGFTLVGPYVFAYLWPGMAGYTFLSKNPYAKSGQPTYAAFNVTFNKPSWTQKGGVEVVITTDRTAEKMVIDPLMDVEGWASTLLPNLVLLLAVLFGFASITHMI